MYTIQDYFNQPQALSFQEAETIHRQMVSQIDDSRSEELYRQCLQAGKDYIAVRCQWAFQTKDQRKQVNDTRTKKHNAVIRSLDALAQYNRQQGKETEWRKALGYEENGKGFRKRIGDMGCYLAFVLSLSTR